MVKPHTLLSETCNSQRDGILFFECTCQCYLIYFHSSPLLLALGTSTNQGLSALKDWPQRIFFV